MENIQKMRQLQERKRDVIRLIECGMLSMKTSNY